MEEEILTTNEVVEAAEFANEIAASVEEANHDKATKVAVVVTAGILTAGVAIGVEKLVEKVLIPNAKKLAASIKAKKAAKKAAVTTVEEKKEAVAE